MFCSCKPVNKAMEWTHDKTLQFIEEYKTLEILWNYKLEEFKDINKKAEIVQKLSEKYECPLPNLKRKIKNLRSSLHREHKALTHPCGVKSQIKKKKWCFYDNLSFLLEFDQLGSYPYIHTYYKPVNSKNEPKYLEEMTYGDENTSPGPDEFANPFEESEISLDAPPVLERSDAPLVLERSNATEPKSSALPQTANKAASRVDFDFINEAITRLEEVTARTKTCSRLGDLDAFGHYVVASLRCLKSDTALQAQIEIREIVERALEEIVLGDDAADEFTEVYERIHGDVPHTAAIPDQNGISHVDDSGQTSHAANSKSKPNDDGIENHDPLHPGSSLPPNSTETTASRVPDLTSTSEPNRKRKRLTSRSDVINHVLNKVDCMMDEVKNGQSDQYELLGRYITDSLQKMPPPLALRVQKDLYSVVIKYKLGSLENNNISDTL